MQVYTVKSGSIAVRSDTSNSAQITNILPTGSTIYVVDEEDGWLRTSGGYYILKTNNLELSSPRPMLRATGVPPGSSLDQQPPPGPFISYTTTTGGIKTTVDDIRKTEEATKAEQDTGVDPKDCANTNDQVINMTDQEKALTEMAKGRIPKFTQIAKFKNGEIVVDANGNYEMGDVPSGINMNELRVSRIKEFNGKKYLISVDSKGGEYVSPLESSEIGERDEKSGAVIYRSGSELITNTNSTNEANEQEASILDQISNIGSKIITAWTDITELTVEDARTIHGMPYQFMPIVDPRLEKGQEISAFNSFGRKFLEKIVARASILYMQAGGPIFLRGYSDEAKQSMMEALVSQIESSDDAELKKLLDDQNAQYYSFEERSTQYFKAVNSACTVLAHLLQIESVQIETLQPRDASNDPTWGQTVTDFLDPKALGNINWSMRTSKSLGFYGGAVAFYINSENQIQETFINSTQKSQLAGKINQVADYAKEAAFLMGGLGNLTNFDTASGLAQSLYANRNKDLGNGTSDKEFMGSSFLGSVVNNITNLIAGGKMIFPEIWSDSSFQRTYNVTIKLDSPDSDTVSIFLNVLVPLVHILGFVLPISAGPNMYTSPFLVRCFYKSTFHIDMGIIKSCTVTKGDTGAWNCDGLPTQVTVELQIADLYDRMAQSLGEGSNTLISNPAQLEYLANLAGVNVAPASFVRAIELWFAVKGINRMKQNLVGTAREMMQSVFRKMQSLGAPTRSQY